MSNKDRVEIKQLPDWLRRAMALPERFRKGHAMHVPIEVEVTFNDVLERMLAGFGRNLQAVSNLKMKTLVETAQQILDVWRECCDKLHKDYIFQCLFVSYASSSFPGSFQIEVFQLFPQGFSFVLKFTRNTGLSFFKPSSLACVPFVRGSQDQGVNKQSMRDKAIDSKWVCRFLHKWQWSYQASNTKGAFLANDSVEMIEARKAHRSQRQINGAPWELVLNFDQLWRSAYEAPKKVLHKRQTKEAGRQQENWREIRPSDLVGKRLRTVSSIAEQAMQSRMGQTDRPSKLRKTVARSEFVIGGRQGLTAVTSTWGNGEMGPLGICLTTGSVPQSTIRSLNEEWFPNVYLFESGTETHFMNADTTLLYLQELVGPVPRSNRRFVYFQLEDIPTPNVS